MNATVETEPQQDNARPVSVPEVRALLEKEQGTRDDLAYEQKLALEHATVFARIPPEKAEALASALQELPRLTDWHRRKIVDICPSHADDVRAIFAKDRFNLENDEIEKILNAVKAVVE